VRGVLVDTGPLVAVIHANDAFHEVCVETLKQIQEPLFTVWPVITEALYLIRSLLARERLWDLLEQHQMQSLALETADIPGIRALMKKYADVPMDLADAALVHVAARDALHTIFTIDRTDFGIYRLPGGRRLRLLP
jgi:predicted nucleic acid-binding protein